MARETPPKAKPKRVKQKRTIATHGAPPIKDKTSAPETGVPLADSIGQVATSPSVDVTATLLSGVESESDHMTAVVTPAVYSDKPQPPLDASSESGPAGTAGWLTIPIRQWRWSLIPLCVFLILLIPPANDKLGKQKAVEHPGNGTTIPAKSAQNVVSPAGPQRGVESDRADPVGQLPEKTRLGIEPSNMHLATPASVDKGFEQRAVSAEKASEGLNASLKQANEDLDAQRRKLQILANELNEVRKTASGDKHAAELAKVERDKAVNDLRLSETSLKQAQAATTSERSRADSALKDLRLSEISLKQAQAAITSERSRANSALKDLDTARMQRDAAKHASENLTAALEQERRNNISLADRLSAARRAMDLIKSQSDVRKAHLERGPNKPAITSSVTKSKNRRSRDSTAPARQKPPLPKSLPEAVATITLPEALLPSP
ncbi:hypothetical protein [Mesorhizobium sp. ES1-1]|uniref:hypothetical protein n=1 Tax=Mesorhizobium sp. ES1-1 TaxID=2876629 RepID=UPI001CCA5AF4|nr:hypothetical protein [Mesorhizobium sp. ES1-1]MBZ9674746.1 hypothetical protein [Mesorhizobium sp. ES1-1]